MIEEADFVFAPWGPTTTCRERKAPTDDLSFSGGSPIVPLQLIHRQQRCLRLTVGTRLFESPSPNTHYWFSQDMEWWFSAARQVLDDIHMLLMRQNDADKSFLFWTSLSGPWRCGTWKSEATWLSRFIHRYYQDEGKFLHPFRNKVDKHLKEIPDTLRFDIFLLQCWSEMRSEMHLSPEEQTFFTILAMNDESPEVCMQAIQARMDSLALVQEQEDQPQEPQASPQPWIPRPSQDLDQWAHLQPELHREHRVMFRDYTRHLRRECEIQLEEYALRTMGLPPTEDRHGDLVAFCQRFMVTRILSYMDSVITLAQRELGMVRGTRSSSSASSSSSTWTAMWLHHERSEVAAGHQATAGHQAPAGHQAATGHQSAAGHQARLVRQIRAARQPAHGPVM